MEGTAPYLSVVVTTRNDDHGGDLMRRTQTFVNCLLAQCRRHRLDAELILVEWNPPPDRPPLAEALRWPAEPGPCAVRIIQVPPEIHYSRYQYGDALPLYQMIGKNVGIRRARGEFILATNIDILFNDDLVAFLAARRLRKDKMYRMDRHDVASDVPVDASVEEQLQYCRWNQIRLNAREGTFPLMPDGQRAGSSHDVATLESGIRFGRGWYPPESDGLRRIRWLTGEAELLVLAGQASPARILRIEAEPGPGMQEAPCKLLLRDAQGKELGRASFGERSLIHFQLPEQRESMDAFLLKLEGGGHRVSFDSRILNMRVYACEWGTQPPAAQPALVERKPLIMEKLQDLCHHLWHGEPFRIPFARYLLWLIRHLNRDEFGIALQLPALRLGRNGPRNAREQPEPVLETGPPARLEIPGPVHLHTNGCGDFTLLQRDRWFDLRGYPELDTFSMNIDSLFCWAAHYAGVSEVVLEEPMRIYHIEHGSGSGWTPEGQTKMYARLKERGIAWLDFQTVLEMARFMDWQKAPTIFNLSSWGLAEDPLKDDVIGGGHSVGE